MVNDGRRESTAHASGFLQNGPIEGAQRPHASALSRDFWQVASDGVLPLIANYRHPTPTVRDTEL